MKRWLGLLAVALAIAAPARAQDTMNTFEGANPNEEGVIYSKTLNAVVGTTPALLTRPAGFTRLSFSVTGGDVIFRPGDYRPKTFTAATTDIVTATAHAFTTGDGPFQLTNSGGALPAGLAVTTDYYVIVIDANTFRLATSRPNALAGTPVVDITGTGTGTHTLGGTTAVPAVTTSSGYLWYRFQADFSSVGGPVVIKAPDRFTVVGAAAGTIFYYWWLP